MCRPVSLENISTWMVEHPKSAGFGVAIIFALGALLGYYLGHISMWYPIGIGGGGLIISSAITAILYSKQKKGEEAPPAQQVGSEGQNSSRAEGACAEGSGEGQAAAGVQEAVVLQDNVEGQKLINEIRSNRPERARTLYLKLTTVLAKDHNGNTVLHLALKNYSYESQELIKEIIRLAPQLKDVPNLKGVKPIDLASNCTEEIRSLLK
jgi:hypothetical protein